MKLRIASSPSLDNLRIRYLLEMDDKDQAARIMFVLPQPLDILQSPTVDFTDSSFFRSTDEESPELPRYAWFERDRLGHLDTILPYLRN